MWLCVICVYDGFECDPTKTSSFSAYNLQPIKFIVFQDGCVQFYFSFDSKCVPYTYYAQFTNQITRTYELMNLRYCRRINQSIVLWCAIVVIVVVNVVVVVWCVCDRECALCAIKCSKAKRSVTLCTGTETLYTHTHTRTHSKTNRNKKTSRMNET